MEDDQPTIVPDPRKKEDKGQVLGRPPSRRRQEADPLPDQTIGAGPIPLEQSNETDDAQKGLRGSGRPG